MIYNMFEFREVKNESEYKPLIVAENALFTQAWFFGRWQEVMGRKVERFEIRNGSKILGFFQIIKYPLVFSKSFLYIPHALVLRSFSEGGGQHFHDFLKEFRKKLIEIGKEENAVFTRFDLCSHNSNSGSEEDLDKYFKKVPSYAYRSSYFQPKFEWLIDLTKTEEEILSEMHPKTRYNINLALRRGIKVEITNENFNEYFPDFYELLEETAKRDNFNLHPEIYYENIFKSCEKNQNAFLSVAKYNSKILAINLILFFGNVAYFLFGGSSDEHKNFMFSYLAQWEAIKEAKKRGFGIYNFGAVNGKNFEGISRFKKGFGGKLLEYSDSYDIVLKPFWYFLYNLRKKFQFH